MSGYVDYDHESGKCAYEAYRRTNEYGSHTDRRLPEWDKLPANIKEGWIAAAEAVTKREGERVTQFLEHGYTR